MDLIYLHGPPASGKLTIAKELQLLTGAKLFDNHAAIDFAKTLFEFVVPPFWDFVQAARVFALDAAGQSNLPLVIFTTCYSHPHDLPLLKQISDTIAKNGGKILPVFISCDTTIREQRVGNPDRVSRGKISSPGGLKNFEGQWNIAPIPHPDCIQLDSGIHSAAEIAKQIVSHFNL